MASFLFTRQISAQIENGGSFNKDKYYQGEPGTITITIFNDHNDRVIRTKTLYLQFDWQNSGDYFASYENPDLLFGSSYTFTINFNIPQNTSVGNHVYRIVWVDKIILFDNITVKSGSLYVHDPYEIIYYTTYISVIDDYLQARPFGSTAYSLVKQAEDNLSVAGRLSNQGSWKEAIIKLNDVKRFLEQASISSEEATHQYKMILIEIMVIVIIGVVIYLRYIIIKI